MDDHAGNDQPKPVFQKDLGERREVSRGYWRKQDDALGKALAHGKNWTRKRRESSDGDQQSRTWKRVTFSLPRSEAQAKAREFLQKYPKAAYWSEVESWRELPGDVIEFTMRRLPTAD